MEAKRRCLIFGGAGKLGSALTRVFADDWDIRPVDSREVDVTDRGVLRRLLTELQPEVVFNAKVIGGVDVCEQVPGLAFRINTSFPAHLAELSAEQGFILVHFSTDAVFPDCQPGSYHTESSPAVPINSYALSKFGADCLIPAITPRAYVLRLSRQFGQRPSPLQFVERMMARALAGEPLLRVADDVVCSPSSSMDVARRVREFVEGAEPFGLYHVANRGQASLHEFLIAAVELLGASTVIQPVPSDVFPLLGRRSIVTPLCSEKIPPLRPWQEALADFCQEFKARQAVAS